MGAIPSDWAPPLVTPWNREWFTSGTLAIQVCATCDTMQHPPEEVCFACGSDQFGHRVLAPCGTVFSFTIVHYAAGKALAESVPYAVVLVSLDEAPEVRVVGNVVDTELDAIAIGLRVECCWEDRTGPDGTALLLPQWRVRPDDEWGTVQ